METTGCWSQLGLVMWRQVWLSRVRRHYLVTLLELTCMLFMMSSVWEESVAPYRARPNKDQFFDSADAMEFWGRPNESWNEGTFAFAPNQAFFADLVARVCKELGSKWTPMPFKDAAEATQYVEGPDDASSETAGHEQQRRVAVWFERPETDRLTYHVRIRDAMFDLRDDYKRSLLVPGPADIDLYDEIRLLLPLQYFVESAYIHMIAESLQKQINVKVELMRFPYPRLFYGSEDRTLSRVSLRFVIAFFVPFCVLVVKLVKEKRVGAKEMLRRAGLSDVAYWVGHFFESGFVVLCAVLLMYVPLFVILNSNGTAFIEFANPVVVMSVLLLFGVLTILHAMLLTVFLWGPGVAFAAAVVYWFALGLLPYALLQNPLGLGYYLISRSTKLISALSPVMYLHWCLRVIERFEKYEVRLTWKNIFDSSTTLDNVSVGELSLLSLSAALVLVGLIWYLDNVVPWGYGVPKPLYFIFSADYWSPYRKWNIRNVNYAQDKNYFEADPKNADAIVHLINLSATNKESGDIKNIILTIFNKQITVILGPQDCGHVTLLDIITGRQLPTSGEAYVCNFDASGYSGRSWEYLSVCPEERELFDDMTVEEHLLFFLFLRQVPGNTGEAYVAMLMRQLNIEQYKDTLVSAMSPRLRRVVCVAITACAVEQTPLVIFPDPTRLLDPKGRHQVWEVLARLSRRSSVLVTTKSIEEAEVLADRLVIMREGRIECAGSPTWLKTRFDSGFFLRFTKLPNFREHDVTRVVKYHMGAVEPKRVSKLETVYNLSESLQHVSRMATMLHYLEKRRAILGIAFMSLTYCTLEDVYIRMVSGPDGNMGGGDTRAQAPASPADGSDPAKEKQEQDAVRQWCTARSTKAGMFSVLWALLRKRGIIWLRVWWTKPLSVGIPVACMLLLALSERHFLPDIPRESGDITYEPENIFDVSYGFIEKDNARYVYAATAFFLRCVSSNIVACEEICGTAGPNQVMVTRLRRIRWDDSGTVMTS
ncbi:hypothetical protein HPB52_009395 [Rhipicephalus sanguineus]|uniref:ABC transporter domain-containing protein n=1 Tax=Rhipicephalus sanguineus TaxID=34632 RepID=A0A9D4SMM7_RHISA|nr:hypothetical protein HPB52_009395 [Rhipicephalus sanguineus]